MKFEIKLTRGYTKYDKILAKIEKPEVDVYVRKNVSPMRFATISLRATGFET